MSPPVALPPRPLRRRRRPPTPGRRPSRRTKPFWTNSPANLSQEPAGTALRRENRGRLLATAPPAPLAGTTLRGHGLAGRRSAALTLLGDAPRDHSAPANRHGGQDAGAGAAPLFEGRVREDLIRRMNETERTCKEDPYLDQWITEETRKRSALPTAPPSLDLSSLDTAPDCGKLRKRTCPHACPSSVPAGLSFPGVSPALQSRDMNQIAKTNPPRPLRPPPELGAGGSDPLLTLAQNLGEGRRGTRRGEGLLPY